MKLSELMGKVEYALEKFGDLECFVDSDDEDEDCCAELADLICEIRSDGTRHILLTQYNIEFTKLSVVK